MIKAIVWVGVLGLAIASGAIVPIAMLAPIVLPAWAMGYYADKQRKRSRV